MSLILDVLLDVLPFSELCSLKNTENLPNKIDTSIATIRSLVVKCITNVQGTMRVWMGYND